jgi:hypothetical protein
MTDARHVQRARRGGWSWTTRSGTQHARSRLERCTRALLRTVYCTLIRFLARRRGKVPKRPLHMLPLLVAGSRCAMIADRCQLFLIDVIERVRARLEGSTPSEVVKERSLLGTQIRRAMA